MTLVEVVVSLAITGLTVAGIVSGYIYCSTATAKDALFMAANTQATARMEAVRAARWDTSSYPTVDQLMATNFPPIVVDLSPTSPDVTNVQATIRTQISQISTTPQLRQIRVDCVWLFQGNEIITNTIQSDRAPDQ